MLLSQKTPFDYRFTGGFAAAMKLGGAVLALTMCGCGGSGTAPAHASAALLPSQAPPRSERPIPRGDAHPKTTGEVPARLPSDEARALSSAALARKNAGDGAGCLRELDSYDKLESNSPSTDPKTDFEYNLRATCLMLSGQCDAGKQLKHKWFEIKLDPGAPPFTADEACDGFAVTYCRSDDLNPRERLLQALKQLKDGARSEPTLAFCQAAYDVVVELREQVTPRYPDEPLVHWLGGNRGPGLLRSGLVLLPGARDLVQGVPARRP